jgi:tetratricopeptide (TPR) repeat protein
VRTTVGVCGVVALVGLTPQVSAQRTAECATIECPKAQDDASQPGPAAAAAIPEAWQAAARLHQLKLRVVDSVQRVTRAQVGTFGDEGRDLASGMAAMRYALGEWDSGIRELESSLARTASSAERYVIRGTVYLDRYRIDDALRAFDEAARLDPERADVPMLQALAHAASGKHADAWRALGRAASRDPGSVTIAYTQARQAAQLQQPEDARRALARVVRLVDAQSPPAPQGAPTEARAPFERVDLLRQSAGVAPIFPLALYADAYAAVNQGDLAGAVAAFDKAIPRDPLTGGRPATRELVARGGAELRGGRIGRAIEVLRAAVEAAPDDSDAHRILALALWADEQYTNAVEEAATAVRLNPADERARLMLVDALRGAGRSAEAEAALEAALVALPRSGTTRYRLAERHRAEGRLPEAIEAYRESAAHEPIFGQDHLYFTIGSLSANRADFDGAAAAYVKRVEVNPNSAEGHRQLAEIYFLQGRDDEAMAEFSVATFLDPVDGKAHAGRGQVLLRSKKPGEAATAFARAVALGHDTAEVQYGLGTALLRAGRADEGRRALEASQRHRADDTARGQRDFQLDALRRGAAGELAEGRRDRAIELLEGALEMDAGSSRSHRELGLALVATGRTAEGIEHLEQAHAREPSAELAAALADAHTSLGHVDARERHLGESAQLRQQAKQERVKALSGR